LIFVEIIAIFRVGGSTPFRLPTSVHKRRQDHYCSAKTRTATAAGEVKLEAFGPKIDSLIEIRVADEASARGLRPAASWDDLVAQRHSRRRLLRDRPPDL